MLVTNKMIIILPLLTIKSKTLKYTKINKFNMEIKLIICDFDGVLYNFDENNIQDGLYCNIKNTDPILHENVKNFLFRQNKHIFYAWMRGWVDHNDLHYLMAKKFNTTIEFLEKELLDSIKQFSLNWELLNLIQNYRNKGIKAYILSDNITPFTKILVPHFKLDNYFDKIYSSSDFHILKSDDNIKWLEDIIKTDNFLPEETLFIDDGETNIQNAKNRNVNTYLYNFDTRHNFENWARENIKQ